MLGTPTEDGAAFPTASRQEVRWTRPLGRQPTRILEALGQVPGQNVDELSATLGLRRTAVNHHVRVLLRVGRIVRVRQGRHALHFLVETRPQQRVALSLLRIPGVQAVATDVFREAHGGCADRADRLGLSPRHVRRALRLLAKHGMARVEKGGRRVPDVTHLHPELRLVLALQQQDPGADAAGLAADLP